jgi:hypothetical protein
MFNARRVFRLCSLPVPTFLLRASSDVLLTSLPRDAKHELFTVMRTHNRSYAFGQLAVNQNFIFLTFLAKFKSEKFEGLRTQRS